MEAELAREGGGFRDDVFTPAEIASCTSQSHSALHFATRFAVKEAVLKALGTGVLDGASWREIGGVLTCLEMSLEPTRPMPLSRELWSRLVIIALDQATCGEDDDTTPGGKARR